MIKLLPIKKLKKNLAQENSLKKKNNQKTIEKWVVKVINFVGIVL